MARTSIVDSLAGIYLRRFQTVAFETGDGKREYYTAEDKVEIEPLRENQARIDFILNFSHGHLCQLSGIARVERNILVYHEPREHVVPGEDRKIPGLNCRLRIWRDAKYLRWSDGLSCNHFCGRRGNFDIGKIPLSSRRLIAHRRNR